MSGYDGTTVLALLEDGHAYANENCGGDHAHGLWELYGYDLAIPLIIACPCCRAENGTDALVEALGPYE